MPESRSPHLYMERRGLLPTRRRPRPRFVPSENGVLSLPVSAPRPWPPVLSADGVDGQPPPDAGPTRPWPDGYQPPDPEAG